jgi:UDP-N-acetylmuramyl pentapeptide phosphotransferase/UDP-N-acetylglucosamine-1-phosphate transferase
MHPSLSLAPLVTGATLAFATAFALALLLVLTRRFHLRLTGDSHLHLPQKIHRDEIPRVGGVAIVAGFVTGLVHLVWFGRVPPAVGPITAAVLLAGLAPIALVGFAEDLTKRVGPKQRLLWMALGAAILAVARGLWLDRVDVPLLDLVFAHWPVALVFSVFALVGAANAYNIVDGLDGLLAGVSLITLAAIAGVAAAVGDAKVFTLAVLLATATLGWLPFNWPRARLFAGDGGAYALGFLTAALLLLLVDRNRQVSPWFGLTAAALPVWETLYSIWRRARTGYDAMAPDQAHLHQLVRLRLHWLRKSLALRRAGIWSPDWTPPDRPAPPLKVAAPNGLCSPVLWSLHAAAATAGAAFHGSTPLQAATLVAFALAYVLLHRRLLRSRAKYRLALSG